MSVKRATSIAALAASLTVLASPASALFGPTCIPTLYNCMCTFRVPCPVTDAKGIAQKIMENAQMDEKLFLLRDLKMPHIEMLMAMNGTEAYGIPGLGSLGIDINGLLNGNLASLGLPDLKATISAQLKNIGIDGDLISSIAKGELGVNAFIKIAKQAGVDLSALDQIGMGIDKITQLANGALNVSEILDLSKALNLQAGILADIGITEDLIVSISKGEIKPDKLLSLASKAGLDIGDLAGVGLDMDTLTNLANASPEKISSILQNTGFGSSIISELGLDAGMIAKISTGELPPNAINQLVKGTGIDPSAITIPGVNGPINVSDLIGSNIPKGPGSGMGGAAINPPKSPGENKDGDTKKEPSVARAGNINEIISIPTSGIPGLDNAIKAALGKDEKPGLFSGPDSNRDLMCETDRTLISVSEPPNGYGDDPETIHMAISGGTLEVFEEAVDAANSVGGSTSAFGYARAIQIRPILIQATAAVDTFDEMMGEAKSLQDDIIVNDTIKGQLMTAKAESASMLTSITSTFAATQIRRKLIDATPIFPATARWRDEVIKANQELEAKKRSQQQYTQSSSSSTAHKQSTQLTESAQGALNHYQMIQQAQGLEAHIPSLEEGIDVHESYKAHLYSLEMLIKRSLEALYVKTDSAAAWDTLHPELLRSAGGYTDNGKWEAGFQRAQSLSSAVTAQSSSTKYGRRVPTGYDPVDNKPLYSTVPDSAYSYPAIDRTASQHGGPYKPIRAPIFSGGGGGTDSPKTFSKSTLTGLIQYYLATVRREAWFGDLRRGDADRVMSGSFWAEMLHHAPSCLSGPIQVSPEALARRSEMFDLDKGCTHLYWSGGDPEDYIDPTHLGGIDASLWASKITLDKISLITQGPAAVQEEIQNTLNDINGSSAATLLEMSGNPDIGRRLDAVAEELKKAQNSADFSAEVSYPQ